MSVQASKKYGKILSGKIIIALLLACTAILLSFFISRHTFRQVLHSVNTLVQPNPRLRLVNRLFKSVVSLDQLQRMQTLQPTGQSYNPFFKESKDIMLMLDSLREMSRGDTAQLLLVDSMKNILRKRDKIFLNYLDLRSEFISNDTLTSQIHALTETIRQSAFADSSIITTEKKIVTTTVEDMDSVENSRPSFWNRLLGRKKTPEYTQRKRLIQEELNITIDTLAMAREDSIIRQLTAAITSAESDRRQSRNTLINRQLQLNRAGNLLVSRLLSISHKFETEELQKAQSNNSRVTETIDTGIRRMNAIIIGFICGVTILTFMIFTDIIRSNRYRKELVLAKEEAEQSGLVKQRFLANMSHELRTPLQSIVGISEQLHTNGNATAKDLNIIYQSSRHLLQVVNQVLDYSHIVSDKFKFEEQPFSVAALVKEVKESLEISAAKKQLAFVYENDLDETAQHIGDAFRLRQILYNLLANAIKFTTTGGVTLSVKHKDYTNNTVFTVSVTDTGIGIAEQDVARIFNMFEQGQNVSEHAYKGTGLGLGIVKSLVEHQNGNITVHSTPGKGATFTVKLTYPRTSPSGEQTPGAVIAPLPPGITVWVVDDDLFILDVCRQILTKHGLAHRCFSSPTQVLQENQSSPPDVMFIDIRMPDMDGFTLLRRLKTIQRIGIRYYALTAQALPDDKEAIMQQGFDGLLMKPFMENELLRILQTVEVPPHPAQIANELAKLRTMIGDDPATLKRICERFITETQEDLQRYEQGLSNTDGEMLADSLHKLSGRFGQTGFYKEATTLRSAEQAIRAGKDVIPMMPELKTLARMAADKIDALQDYINIL